MFIFQLQKIIHWQRAGTFIFLFIINIRKTLRCLSKYLIEFHSIVSQPDRSFSRDSCQHILSTIFSNVILTALLCAAAQNCILLLLCHSQPNNYSHLKISLVANFFHIQLLLHGQDYFSALWLFKITVSKQVDESFPFCHSFCSITPNFIKTYYQRLCSVNFLGSFYQLVL